MLPNYINFNEIRDTFVLKQEEFWGADNNRFSGYGALVLKRTF